MYTLASSFTELSGDLSWIKCAHFKNGNLSVETPTQVLPFHVVLENPSFSSLGVFFWNLLPKAVAKYIPIHGKVLLYFKKAGRQCVEYKIHLYLLPAFAPIDKVSENSEWKLWGLRLIFIVNNIAGNNGSHRQALFGNGGTLEV